MTDAERIFAFLDSCDRDSEAATSGPWEWLLSGAALRSRKTLGDVISIVWHKSNPLLAARSKDRDLVARSRTRVPALSKALRAAVVELAENVRETGTPYAAGAEATLDKIARLLDEAEEAQR